MNRDNAPMLTTCEREPIHTPGMIQSHGVLLALNESDLIITDVSHNVVSIFGQPAERMLGTSLGRWLGAGSFKRLLTYSRQASRNALQPITLQIASSRRAKRRRWDVFVHRHAGKLLLEFEPTVPASGAVLYYNLLRTALGQIHATSTAFELADTAAAVIRDLTQYDRVMVYRFDDDWHGEVVAESRRDDLPPYLHHHFPASDIPRQARATFLSNWVRMIPDVNYDPIPLLSSDTAQPLDMERALLRAVSPVHLTYLKNMGTQATLTITLKTDEKLWGLIACHHELPKKLFYGARLACELMGKSVSAIIPARQQKQDARARAQLRAAGAQLVQRVEQFGTLHEGLGQNPELLLRVAAAEGAAVRVDAHEKWLLAGNTPPRQALDALAHWLSQQMGEQKVFSTSHLAQLYGPGKALKAQASGVLAISIPQSGSDIILWFRPEEATTKVWAGDPRKQVTRLPDGSVQIEPRQSFEGWKEQVRLRSRPWTEVECEAALELRTNLVSAELQRQFQLARQAVQLRDSFLSIASHELKTPLTSMQLQSDMTRRRIQDKEMLEKQELQKVAASIQKVGEGMNRLSRLVDDMLDVSRINTGTLNMRYAVEDVASLADNVIERMRVQFETAGVPLTTHFGPRAATKLDRLRIEQVLWNLLANALRYGDGAPVHVEAGKRGGKACIVVCDKGPGISPNDRCDLFRKYKPAGAKYKGAGLGLGLHICKHIIEQHGGTLTLDSTVGAGSTFTVLLPVTLPHAEET